MTQSIVKSIFFLHCLTLFFTVKAQDLSSIPGLIPLTGPSPVATDLEYQGKLLTPFKIKELQAAGNFDFSQLEPAPSNLYRADLSKFDYVLRPINFNNNFEFEFRSNDSSRAGIFRFAASQNDLIHGDRTFTFRIAKRQANDLLRLGLLRKLGFTVPNIQRLPRITLNFTTPGAKELFINQLTLETQSDPRSRWLIEEHKGDPSKLELQDVLVTENPNNLINLSIGYVPNGVIKNRRVFNSLLIPFALTEVPESVNLLEWRAGRLFSDHLKFETKSKEEFEGNLDDAKWIARKIAKLTRNDFVEIVRGADLPAEVSYLLIEKLIARRNSLVEMFKLPSDQIKFNPEVTFGEHLKKGKILKEKWEGYANRFAYGDPTSPFSSSEKFALGRSKVYSNTINNLVSRFNTEVLPRTDLAEAFAAHQQELFFKQFLEFLQTGKVKETPFGVWSTPILGGDLILSRDIITGAYLGTDNLVQLADSFGVSLNAGLFIGFDGMPTNLVASGGANTSFTRTYTHLKPVTSIKEALKYPYKNMFVNGLIKSNADLISEILFETSSETQFRRDTIIQALEKLQQKIVSKCPEIRSELGRAIAASINNLIAIDSRLYKTENIKNELDIIDNIINPCKKSLHPDDTTNKYFKHDYTIKDHETFFSETQKILDLLIGFGYRNERIEKVLNMFLDNMPVGDSLIITDSVGADLSLRAGYSFSDLVKAYLDFRGGMKIISRLHINRADKHTIHIYKDHGNLKSLIASFRLNVGVQILTMSTEYHTGNARTKFYTLDINPSEKENPNLLTKVEALKSVLLDHDLEMLHGLEKPYLVEHDFTQKKPFNWRFLWAQSDTMKFNDLIKVTHPEGEEKILYRHSKAVRKGDNYQAFSTDIINYALEELLEKSTYFFGSGSTSRPEFTFYGSSELNSVTFDAEVDHLLKSDLVIRNLLNKLTSLCGLIYQPKIEKTLLEFSTLAKEFKRNTVSHQVKFNKLLESYSEKTIAKICPRNAANAIPSYVDNEKRFSHLLELTFKQFGPEFRMAMVEDNIHSQRIWDIQKSYVNINYSWRGWIANAKKLKKFLNEINKKNYFPPYKDFDFHDTSKINLYNISLDYNVYQNGLSYLLALSLSDIEKILTTYSKKGIVNQITLQDKLLRINGKQTWAKNAKAAGKLNEYAELMIELIQSLEDQVNAEGLIQLFGGKENIFVTSTVAGFRQNDENGDQRFFGDTIGQIGDKQLDGPLNDLRSRVGMTQGEFLIFWLVENF